MDAPTQDLFVPPEAPGPGLLLAEFDEAAHVLDAAEAMRDAGFTAWDVHTPFPIHGMDRAMGMRDSRLGYVVIVCALTGMTAAFVMMWWMNKVDYPYVVGGKPPLALPSMVPIMFEMTILLSAFGAVFGMLALNQLPRHHHPLFESDRFRAATDDKFFVSVSTRDPRFDPAGTRAMLERAHAVHFEIVADEVSS